MIRGQQWLPLLLLVTEALLLLQQPAVSHSRQNSLCAAVKTRSAN
jgi:hypothetical protein